MELGELGRVHFVGIGGAGMSGIARIMLTAGLEVSGCDARDSRAVAALRARGAVVEVGHDVTHVERCDTLVVSSAIRPDNPPFGSVVGSCRVPRPWPR
jgi:UDP-N-acetylmuramate--alanine ligase